MKNKFKIIAFVLAGLVSINTDVFAQSKATVKCKSEVSLGTHAGTFGITKAELMTFKELTLKNDCYDGATFLSFDLTTTNNGKTIFSHAGGLVLNESMREAIKKVNVGSKVFIDNVMIKKTDGTIKVISGITIIVK